ncbi:MAG: serine hydrolase [Pseudomonadales bacterium]|nr:serine hydrolase [Pseudomonadales bacterium]
MVLVVLLLFAMGGAQAFEAERFRSVVERGMADWQVPGMAVAVIEDGEVVFQEGFGRTVLDAGAPVDTHTLFANASTTKAMVVSGILMLVDEGRLSLDAPVIDVLPELHFQDPALAPQLTLRDLLAHRTGLPSTDVWTFYQGMPLDEQIRRLRAVPSAAAPRTRLIYQNTMYELAGLMIERASGKPWEAFLEERLWGPVGMDETVGMRGRIPRGKAHAMPYGIFDGAPRRMDFSLRPELADAAGSVWSSIHDMTRWAQFLLRGGVTEDGRRLVSEASWAQVFEPQQIATPEDFYPTVALTKPQWRTYSLGWYQQDFGGRRIDFHTGSLNGLVAIIGLERAANRAVIVMANRDHAELRHALLWEVMDLTPASSKRDWHTEVLRLYAARERAAAEEWARLEAARLEGVAPTLPVASYAGDYASPAWGEVRLAVDGDALALATGARRYRLTPWQGDTFLLMHKDWVRGEFVTFEVTPAGRVAAIHLFESRFAAGGAD